MAFDFPASPATGDVYTPANGPTYQWDGEKWKGGGVAREPDEQFFDLSGLTQKDIVVPSWAKGCKIEGVIFVGQANWPTMRWSGDGSTFLAGASDYSNSGPFHGTGTSLYQTTPVAATDKINLSLGGDNIAYAQVFTTKFNLTRPSTSQVFSVKTYSKALDSAAAQRERTFWHTAYNSGANWTASILAIKAIRIGLGNAGSFAAGSFLLVKWLGDTGQLKVGTSVPDAPADSKLYGRKDNAWIEASPRPQSAAGIGQWVSLAANGVALVLPAGGTWAWFFGGTNTGSGAVTSAFSGGVSAGGTQLAAGAAGTYWQGFAWRIA